MTMTILYANNVTLRSNRSLSLYINNGDVTQTAAVQTAAVCLGQRFIGVMCFEFYISYIFQI